MREESGKTPGIIQQGEDLTSVAILLAMMILPLVQVLYRKLFSSSLDGVDTLVRHCTMLLTFLAAAIAAREGRHLHFETGDLKQRLGEFGKFMRAYSAIVSVGVLLVLAYAGYLLVYTGMEGARLVVPGLPVWLLQLVIPLSMILMAWRIIRMEAQGFKWRLAVLVLGCCVPLLALIPEGERDWLMLPGMIALLLAVFAGSPIFILMGGMAALFYFIVSGGEISALIDIPDAAYSIVTNPFLPAIPLFTMAGAVLAHGKTSERLVELFRAMFASMPGGIAIATALLFALFTTFTGASGVTILALGPLLMPLLMKNAYPEGFSLGLLTSAGSLGMLFPPCLPVILIGVTLAQPITKVFMAGLLPGAMLILIIAGYSALKAQMAGVTRIPFSWEKLRRSAWKAKWEILLPVIVLGGIFSGYTTLVESAAVTALYAIVLELFIHRDFDIRFGLPKAVKQGALLSGGILIIIGLAKGFTQYLVDEMIAEQVADWVQGAIQNRYVFLIVLNLLLLVVGSLMDIVSAIIVIVPLLSPMLGFYNIHPIHFAIIFLVNLEIGFLTPPVGMNLFMSSYTFDKPLTRVYRSVLPFILLWLIGVVLVSYVPWFSLAILGE